MDLTNRILQMPLVNVIPFACEACPTDTFMVTNNCRKCLAHPCTYVCPVNAVSIGKQRAHIDHEKCIRCGKCKEVCPYSAIVRYNRPCAAVCGVDAIESDYLGRAQINEEKCVSCGLCIVSCPFGAISDKSEIFQLVKALGFQDVVEVSLGADISSIHEAQLFAVNVPEKQSYLGTSCCPAWTMTAQKLFPDQYQNISSSHTPMVATAKIVKAKNPDARVVFIGPCIAKKVEALDDEVKPYIDFVITFEELIAMFVAKEIDLSALEDDVELIDSSCNGRGYANCGGVAEAISQNIRKIAPDKQFNLDKADSLADCRKMLLLAKVGKRDGYLIEGMACPGGCVGGPGTLLPTKQATAKVQEFAKTSPYPTALDNPKAK